MLQFKETRELAVLQQQSHLHTYNFLHILCCASSVQWGRPYFAGTFSQLVTHNCEWNSGALFWPLKCQVYGVKVAASGAVSCTTQEVHPTSPALQSHWRQVRAPPVIMRVSIGALQNSMQAVALAMILSTIWNMRHSMLSINTALDYIPRQNFSWAEETADKQTK